MRIFVATFLGVIAAFICILLLEPLGNLLFPLPFKIDPENAVAQLKENSHLIPIGSFISVLFVHAVAIFIGLFVARLIEKESKIPLYILAVFLLYGTVANLFMVPHPIWFSIADILIQSIIGLLFIMKVKTKTS